MIILKIVLISVKILSKYYRIKPKGIIHVGAHLAEEEFDYNKYFKVKKWWVEAQPNLVQMLRSRLNPADNSVIEAAVWSNSKKSLNFHVTNNSQSSSLLELGSHSSEYPSVKVEKEFQVKTKTLLEILPQNIKADFINLDIQGAELEALIGLSGLIHQMKWIYTEVNRAEVYVNCAKIKELDNFLSKKDFHRVVTRWAHGFGWGDALYIRNDSHFQILYFKTLGKSLGLLWMVLDCFNYLKHSIKVTIKKKVILRPLNIF